MESTAIDVIKFYNWQLTPKKSNTSCHILNPVDYNLTNSHLFQIITKIHVEFYVDLGGRISWLPNIMTKRFFFIWQAENEANFSNTNNYSFRIEGNFKNQVLPCHYEKQLCKLILMQKNGQPPAEKNFEYEDTFVLAGITVTTRSNNKIKKYRSLHSLFYFLLLLPMFLRKHW